MEEWIAIWDRQGDVPKDAAGMREELMWLQEQGTSWGVELVCKAGEEHAIWIDESV